MKEIEKLQHRQPRRPSAPLPPTLRHRLAFPLIDFFFLSFPSTSPALPPSPLPPFTLAVYCFPCSSLGAAYFAPLPRSPFLGERRLHDRPRAETPDRSCHRKRAKRKVWKTKLNGCIGAAIVIPLCKFNLLPLSGKWRLPRASYENTPRAPWNWKFPGRCLGEEASIAGRAAKGVAGVRPPNATVAIAAFNCLAAKVSIFINSQL